MHYVLFFIVLVIAAPLILYALPIIMYVIPFIVAGLLLSLIADSGHYHSEAVGH